MMTYPIEDGVWFVYDGECPICTYAAEVLQIKKQFGALHLLNARTEVDHPLMKNINELGFDLDQGMVIYCKGQYYHGKSALKFIGQNGENIGIFSKILQPLYKLEPTASALYPLMRATRNVLLQLRRKEKIYNLAPESEPTFKSIFGTAWDNLPPIIQKHYANRPYSGDHVQVDGTLDIFCAGPIKWLGWSLILAGSIPPYNQKNVPVTVNFRSDLKSRKFHFQRIFKFSVKQPYSFKSYMYQIKNNDVIEVSSLCMGWRMIYSWEDGKVIMRHKGYAIKLGSLYLPVPLHWILGRGYAEETPIDDHSFSMCMHLTHPIFGKIYEYKGTFRVIKEA